MSKWVKLLECAERPPALPIGVLATHADLRHLPEILVLGLSRPPFKPNLPTKHLPPLWSRLAHLKHPRHPAVPPI
ncbi:hypothetical protein B0H10DRAFT_2137877, partial [Mycena sp. CBHHK59/15]